MAGPLLIAATALTAVSSIQQGRAASSAAGASAAINEQNARIAKRKAEADEAKFRRGARFRAGLTRANVAASGIGIEGSPLDIIEDQAVSSELDALNIRFQGLIDESRFLSEASLDRFRAKQATIGGFVGAGTALLTGAAVGFDKGIFSLGGSSA